MEFSVQIKNLAKTFKSRKKSVRALDNVNLSIKKGEIFGLLGPNGAGKTTLISIMTGLLQKDAGHVEILGKDIDKNLHEIQKRINLVLGFTGIGMSLSVKEFLRYYALLYNVDNVKEKVKGAIKAVDLEEKEDSLTLHLSSGYKQRLMLAKALLNEPEVLFLDEPTVGLDVEIAIKIRSLVKELKKKGTTILLTTHNMFEAEELCDRIALISNGRIIAVGTVDEIKEKIKVDNVVEIEADNMNDFMKGIKKQDFAIECGIFEDAVHIKVRDYRDVKKLLRFISKSDYKIYSVRMVEPTLEEAFLKIMRDDSKGNWGKQ